MWGEWWQSRQFFHNTRRDSTLKSDNQFQFNVAWQKMFFTYNLVFLLSLVATAYAQIPSFSSYSTKFRPSPVDQLGNIGIRNFSPADYIINLKAPNFQPTPYKDYQHYNTFPLAGNRPLFTPAETQFPAETSGQIENFNKAIQEEAQQANQQANQQKPQDQFFNAAFTSGEFTADGFGQNEGFPGNGGFSTGDIQANTFQQGELPTNAFALGGFGIPPGVLSASALPPTDSYQHGSFSGENSGKSYVNVQLGGPQNLFKYQYSV